MSDDNRQTDPIYYKIINIASRNFEADLKDCYNLFKSRKLLADMIINGHPGCHDKSIAIEQLKYLNEQIKTFLSL